MAEAPYIGKLAVLYEGTGAVEPCRALALRLGVPLRQSSEISAASELFYLTWRDGILKLLDRELLKKGGLSVDVEPRPGEQRSWPAPKDTPLAQALGRKTQSVVDATTGWGQDSLHIFRMGYHLRCIERSPVMVELLADAFTRLSELAWFKNLSLEPPELIAGDALTVLTQLESKPDCIYIDPMFPPKRKKSALAKKSMAVLHEMLGDDADKAALFEVALQATAKKVVVKSPDYAQPLGGKPAQSFKSKLVRYDVYITR